MTPFFKRVLLALERHKIPYILGADTLTGYSEGDAFKHSPHLKLYLFPTSTLKILTLTLTLLRQRIILKPKWDGGNLFYKLRSRLDPLKKDSTHVRLIKLRPTDSGYEAYLGGDHTFFASDDLNPQTLTRHLEDGYSLSLPSDLEGFVKKYQPALMQGFYQKYVVHFDSNSEKEAVNFMHENVATMVQTGIRFWIEGGTLLGALRDQRLIPWDHDLDFGMLYESETQMKALIKSLRKRFYVSVRGFPNTPEIWQLGKYRVLKIFPRKYYFFKKDLCLDLFVYYEGTLPDTSESVYKYVVWDRNAFHRKEFFEKIEKLEFYGKDVPVPANPEQFIEVKYGDSWRTPIKEWNVALDDGSIYKAE